MGGFETVVHLREVVVEASLIVCMLGLFCVLGGYLYSTAMDLGFLCRV